ncbi:penicillin acylase family protein [Rhodobacteraceae bacterium 2CG4]|uniref:Penicillin acylase family protein n=1 Tax=Halovulum marinum TaxID=2662447 RepID=A0A6L5Z1S8_9RHOB|nr:penicillin acylase family protein [Halovulum marinum]MSU89954.1 penicillin acylase family protein [Halovulum marinum]
MTRTIFNWLLRALALATLLALAAAGLAYYLASHSLPDYDASYRLDDAPGEIEIVRDNYAVPHIFADNDAAVLFGLGFVHAQDRLWQMALSRRVAQGRLSELFGERTVEVDHLMRALDIYDIARRTADAQTDEVKAQLQAYADGVNAYIDLVRRDALGRGAPEFFLFEPEIAPWTPADSIAVMKAMGLRLTDKAAKEALRAALSLRLEPERVADILPEAPGAVVALPDYAGSLSVPRWQSAAAPAEPNPLSPERPVGLAGASNAFAAMPGRAAAGASLLATDPHLGLSAPGPMYLARLELQAGGVIGATIPGIPSILMGRNENVAWGLTSSYLDDQDIYIERLDPENPDRYETPEGMRPFRTRESVIQIDGAPPRTVPLRWTRHGPVIPAPHFSAAQITPRGHVAALAWTGFETDDRSIEAALGIMRAGSVDEVLELAEIYHAPSQNIVVADAETVALRAMGRAPRRLPEHDSQGRIPAAGWVARNDWQGYMDPADNPGATNPEGGIVVNTNNRTTDAPFPAHWSFDWGDTQRIQRAERLLNSREFHTLDSFIEIQNDTISPAARNLLPLIARNLWYQGEPAAQNTVGRQRQIALEALAKWNGEMSQHSFEPLVFTAWVRALQRRLVIDELGPLADRFARPDPLFLERVYRDVDGAAAWCDIRQSDTVETCQDMARLALDSALLELSESYGDRIDSWRWGAAHTAEHKHEVLGDVPLLGWLVNIRQETPGGDTTLRRGQTRGRGPTPYANVHASVFRAVVDFADPESSVFITSTGQSGHVLSRHYDDQALLWRRGEYISMALDPAVARGGAVGITRLRPGGAGGGLGGAGPSPAPQ